jgi:hypothetical protein
MFELKILVGGGSPPPPSVGGYRPGVDQSTDGAKLSEIFPHSGALQARSFVPMTVPDTVRYKLLLRYYSSSIR